MSGMTARLAEATDHATASGSIAEHANELRLGLLDTFIGYHLRLAQNASFNAFARRVGNADLKPGRFAILALIAQNDSVTPTALSRFSGRDKSSITPALHDLEARGLIRRKPMPGDRRSYTLALTPGGHAAVETLMTHAIAHDADLDRIVGSRNKARFLRQLRAITVALTEAPGGDL